MPELRLEHLQQQWVACPYYSSGAVESDDGRAEVARRYVASIFGWAERMIEAAVGSAEEAADFKADLTAAIARRADELEYDYSVAVIVARRV